MDIDAFMAKHERAIFRYCFGICSRRELAEELTQDTFLKVMANIALLSMRTDAERLAWTFTVARNLTLDHLRSRRREQSYAQETANSLSQEASSTEPRVELNLDALTQSLSAEMREVLQLKFELGLNSREISKKISTPEGTVRRRIQIGLSKIKKDIGE